jgi:thioredoxin 1
VPSPVLTPLTHVADVDELLADSFERPVLVLKHSRSCGTSAQAFDELQDHLAQASGDGARYAVVTVQTHRDVSQALASRLGVRHETPQALVLRHGQVAWHASHFRVTADAIAAALDRASTAPATPVAPRA